VHAAKNERERLQEDSRTSTTAAELKTGKSRQRSLKDRSKALMEEHQEADKADEKRQRIDRLKQQEQQQRENLAQTLQEKRLSLQKVLGNDTDLMQMLENNNMVKKLMTVRRERENESVEKERYVSALVGKEQRKASDYAIQKAQLVEREEEQRTIEEELRRVDPRMVHEEFDFDTQLKDLEKKCQDKREESAVNKADKKAMIEVLKRGIAGVKQNSMCLVCQQNCDQHVIQAMEARYNQASSKASSNSSSDREEQQVRQVLEDKITETRQAEERFKRLKKLRVEIPGIQQHSNNLEDEKAALTAEVESAKEELGTLRKAENVARDLKADVDNLTFLHEQHVKFKGELDAATSSSQSGIYLHSKSKAEIKSELQEVQNDLEETDKNVERLEQELRDRNEELDELRQKEKNKEVELAKLEGELAKLAQFEESLRELQDRYRTLEAKAEEARRNKRPLEDKVRRLEADRTRELEQQADEVREEDNRRGECQRDLDQLNALLKRLQDYTQNNGEQRTADAKKAFERDEAEACKLREDTSKLSEKERELKVALEKKNLFAIEIRSNLELRTSQREQEKMSDELKRIDVEIRQLTSADNVELEISKWEEVIRKKVKEAATSKGAVDAVSERHKETQKQLNADAYRKIDQTHAKKLIEVKTTALALADLERYYKALDRALVKFHQTKMEDINRSAKELWNKTYKGTDIDGIEIKSEHEGEDASGRRRHSYRVVMRKGDTTLDMRGRCSAGQKVLACLVIRLALAESFCLNCGILALDEPTTNLDTANSEAFAQALNEVIRHRRAQSNFQLIVITHDEKFVGLLGRSENAHNYFRVGKRIREGEEPHSTIDKLAIEQFG